MSSQGWKTETPLSSFFIRPPFPFPTSWPSWFSHLPRDTLSNIDMLWISVSTWILEGKRDSNSNNLSSLLQCIWVWSYRTAPLGIICEHIHHINLGTSFVSQMKIEASEKQCARLALRWQYLCSQKNEWEETEGCWHSLPSSHSQFSLCTYSWAGIGLLTSFTTPALFLQS